MKRILVVDDENSVRFGIRDFLRTKGLEVHEADSCAAAEESVRTNRPDAAILDGGLLDGDALNLLSRLREVDPHLALVILTKQGTIDLGARAIQSGADQFLTKPVELTALQVLLQRLLETRRDKQRHAARRGPIRQPFIGISDSIRRVEADSHAAAVAGQPVLIQGEPGTGKGVLAEWLHQVGPRAQEPFVDVSCAGLSRELLDSELFGLEREAPPSAIPGKPGLFEMAHHGTLFLDDIGRTDLAIQAKLLDVIEGQRFRRRGDNRARFVDVHLIAASHQDLLGLSRDGKFRQDLFYRIGIIPLDIPPLRERPEDIPPLARALMEELEIEQGIPETELGADAEQLLTSYPWPGNVRELRNALEHAILQARGGPISREHLALDHRPHANGSDTSDVTLAEMERRHIERMLQAENGHVERAARRLGVPRSTLYQWLREKGITPRRTNGSSPP